MANKKIKGLTVEIGGDATPLGKALEGVEAKARDLSSELGQINKLLKMDPGNADLLAQKQKVLAEAVAETSNKLKILKEAEKQVQAQFERGEVSEDQVRALQREIIEATTKLNKYEKAAAETADEIKRLGDSADRAGDDLDGMARDADDAADSVDDVDDSANDADDGLSSLTDTLKKGVKAGFLGLVGAATAAVAALVACVESTEEYRREMGKLDTAFTTSGHSAETAYKTYSDLQAVLGETDQAVEAANHLAKLADNEQELQELTHALTGVYATFGASLPIEGLAEAANETAKVSKVTGPFADAINWAADEGTDWGKVLGDNNKALEAFEEATKEGATAEDAYTAALEACSDEQERQKLIIDTLNELYGEAADVYAEANEEVIASNRATEKLNKVWAAVGKKAAPIVTTFKEGLADMGEVLVKSLDTADVEKFQKTIKSGFEKLSKDVIPKLVKALEWVLDNLDTLTSLATGFIAALAVAKIANFATTIVTKLVPALSAAKTGQEGLNAAASANPYVLLAAAIIGVTTALIGLARDGLERAHDEAYNATAAMHALSDSEQAVRDKANEATEAYRRQRDALAETTTNTQAQFDHLVKLKDELFKLADATGKVEEKDRARAEFILNELNAALGTEYELTGNQIQNYKELAGSIDTVMEKKKAELLLAASGEAYAEAIKNKKAVEEDYYNSTNRMLDLMAEREAKTQEYREIYKAWEEAYFPWKKYELQKQAEAKMGEIQAVQEALDEERVAYGTSKEALQGYYDTIGQYETANLQLLEGNTEEASKILSDLGYYYDNYAADVGYASDEVQNKWEMQVIDAGLKAAHIKERWENGVAGYTDKMVKDSEAAYERMVAAYADAHSDAKGVGEDMASGLETGMDNKKFSLYAKAKSLVSGIIGAMKKEADSNSPSKKTMAFGEDMGAGAEIGLDNKTDDLVKVAGQQVSSILDAYNSQERQSSNVLQGLNEQALSRSSAALQSAAASNGPVLEKILAAIERGQILTIDGNTLVGATVGRTDAALGQQRELVARGAK